MSIWRYALATLPPLAMILAGALWGGWWAALALVWLTLLAAGLDQVLAPPGKGARHSPLADPLSVLLALGHLEGGGESGIYNCGYGRGYSVREVIAAVKQASGVDFAVVEAPRRAGDPEALIAGADRIREVFGWQPKLDDLDRIVAHALAWERHVASRAA